MSATSLQPTEFPSLQGSDTVQEMVKHEVALPEGRKSTVGNDDVETWIKKTISKKCFDEAAELSQIQCEFDFTSSDDT